MEKKKECSTKDIHDYIDSHTGGKKPPLNVYSGWYKSNRKVGRWLYRNHTHAELLLKPKYLSRQNEGTKEYMYNGSEIIFREEDVKKLVDLLLSGKMKETKRKKKTS